MKVHPNAVLIVLIAAAVVLTLTGHEGEASTTGFLAFLYWVIAC